MKKLFDFNSENFILDKLWDWIKKKISNKIMAILLAILLDVSYIGLFFGFFVMPFISYSSLTLKIIFSVLWGMSCVVWIISLIDDWKKQSKDDKWSTAIGLFCSIVFFGLCFVNNNYYHLGEWWQIAIVCVMLLFTIMMIYSFIKELIKNPKDTLASLLMGVLLVFGFLCILGSSLDALEMTERKWLLIIGSFCVGLPLLALMIAYILGISKPKKVMEYGSLVIFCILVLIGVSYIISFLKPEIDGYQTFVTLLAALLGGGLTLVGVAWTIKDGNEKRQKELERIENERKEEERKKNIPYIKVVKGIESLNFVCLQSIYTLDFDKESDIEKLNNDVFYLVNIPNFLIKNVSNSLIVLKGIILCDRYYDLEQDVLIEPNITCQVQTTKNWSISFEKLVDKMQLIVCDVIGNKYKIDCNITHIIKHNGMPITVTHKSGKEYTGFEYSYIIETVSLPELIIVENTNE